MLAIGVSLVPVFVLIVFGWLLRRGGFPGGDFWPALNRLIYYVLFPALLIDNLATAELAALEIAPLVSINVLAVLAVSIMLFAMRPLLAVSRAGFGSVFMGAIRFNTYIGIGTAAALFDAAGLTLAALVIAIQVPLVNLLSVLVLVTAGAPEGEQRAGIGTIVLELAGNPLILASIAGICLNVAGVPLPDVAMATIGALGMAALPLGLMAVGAGLDGEAIRDQAASLITSIVFKLAVMPAAMIAACWILGVSGLTAKISVLFASLPSATTAYVLARQFHGDAPLMAAIITASTIAAAFTMPALILGFN